MKKSLLFLLILFIAGCSGSARRLAASPAPERAGAVEDAVQEAAGTSEVTSKQAATATEAGETQEQAVTEAAAPATASELDHAELLNRVLFASATSDPEAVLAEIRESGDTRFVAGLIDTLRYQRSQTLEIGVALNSLTGQDLPPDWFEWVEWAGQHPEIESFAGYPGWKANLFAQIDPNFLRFVHQGMNVAPDSRVEEIVWGGVRVDGIPALDNPTMIDPEEADYLVPEERVFGLSINGDTRAYPARFLDWHEMFNDVVGSEPVSLAY